MRDPKWTICTCNVENIQIFEKNVYRPTPPARPWRGPRPGDVFRRRKLLGLSIFRRIFQNGETLADHLYSKRNSRIVRLGQLGDDDQLRIVSE